jgi:hypothetical protein
MADHGPVLLHFLKVHIIHRNARFRTHGQSMNFNHRIMTMRAATAIAIASLSLAGWSSGAFAQQSPGSDSGNTLGTAKNSLTRSQEQKDAVSSSTRALHVNRQALKAGRAEMDSLQAAKRAGEGSAAGQWKDTLRLENANKKLSGMTANRPTGQLAALDRKPQGEKRSSIAAQALKSSLSKASTKGQLSAEKDEVKKSR